MARGSSSKRERQQEHIRESERERGASEQRAEEIAARTTNKERAQRGESKSTSTNRTSAQDTSAGRRGARESRGGDTYDQLYEEAKSRNIEGRSKMNKEELSRVLGR
ncbi:plasmid stabilization protein [Streptomyces ureilyticus]|uniref:Plasmid stabilization protein n=1 Tax=Streptomyces ureilyticus TaxID=1775131 RepID=A0ABX0DHK9_9ACTN|nr:plasmid stabilization protein [Streptomyces ureilyticus]NGO41351.1 plasmid stabilization protein [Streptomyces ureilyticus]